MQLFTTFATVLLLLLLTKYGPVLAQDAPEALATQGTLAEAKSQSSSQQLLDAGQLDQLVAPIALYPDPLLAQVLIASTYPLEVVQAERWSEGHKDLKGEALTAELEKEDWDNSIKALIGVPDVLAMMNDDLDWTSKLGDAVLAQQPDVMDAVQRLRELAHENGKLESNDQQTVTVNQEVNVNQAPVDQQVSASEQSAAPQQVIVIEPTSPETVYVPYYEPSVVYGSWPYPDYPPYYFEPGPGYIFGGALATGLAWSAGFAIGNAIWGDGFDWRRNNINVDINRNIDFNKHVDINNKNINVSNWQHNSDHRRGVNYDNADVRNKFSKTNLADKKNDFRGRGDALPDNRPNLGDKRPSVGDLENALKDKPNLGNKRPGGGLADNRPNVGDKRPSVGDLENALKDKPNLGNKRPGGGLADNRPNVGSKRPSPGQLEGAIKDKKPGGGALADKKPNLANKADIKRPDVKKPQVKRPSGNAFDKRDGGKAKDFSNRGKASVGKRSATQLSKKPAAKKPSVKKPAVKKPSVKKPAVKKPSRGGGGGKLKDGGGGKRRR